MTRTDSAAVLIAGGIALVALLPFPWALLGAAPGGLGMVLRPWLAVPAIVLTLPYHLHPKTFGSVELSISEFTLLLTVAAVLVRATIERTVDGLPEIPRAVRLPRAATIDWGVALFLCAGLLSLLVTDYPKQSLRELRWLVVEPILFFYVVRATVSGGGSLVAIVWVIALSGVVAAVVSIADLAVQGALADPGTRGMAPFLSANHLGLFLGRAASASLALLLFANPNGVGTGANRWWSGLAFSTIVVGILRSVSLGAWAGLAAVSLALVVLRSRFLFSVTAAILAGVVLVAIIVLPPERTRARLDPEVGTGLARLYVWDAATRMIIDHPILGIGLDNFLYAYRTQYIAPEAWREPNLSHPHNWLLHFWLQLGLLGLAAASGLMLWTAVAAYRLFHHPADQADRPLAAAVGGMLLDFLVHGSLDNSYFLVDASALWWLAIGLLAARDSGPLNPSSQESQGS